MTDLYECSPRSLPLYLMQPTYDGTLDIDRESPSSARACALAGQPHQNVDFACSPTTGSGVSDSITPTSTNAATKLLQKIDDLV
eukprot:scaffold27951_cov66-Skeletonema_marinoi.AAC.1